MGNIAYWCLQHDLELGWLEVTHHLARVLILSRLKGSRIEIFWRMSSWVPLVRWFACILIFILNFSGDCPDPDCSGRGVCHLETGTCLCDIGWRGPKCESRNPTLHQCLPDCSLHGDYSVELGKCQCHNNWTGRECNISEYTTYLKTWWATIKYS